jgi:hypothetical protein
MRPGTFRGEGLVERRDFLLASAGATLIAVHRLVGLTRHYPVTEVPLSSIADPVHPTHPVILFISSKGARVQERGDTVVAILSLLGLLSAAL